MDTEEVREIALTCLLVGIVLGFISGLFVFWLIWLQM